MIRVSALNNLGVRYGEVGRAQEGVAHAEGAVAAYRDLAAANPSFLPNLAKALKNLDALHRQVEDAV